MEKVGIKELAEVIRSKNSGPYELTLDIIFKDRRSFEIARKSGLFTRELFAEKYGIEEDRVVSVIEYEQANAIKATIVRPVESGGPGETDVYGAQQHAPLLEIEIPVD
ncbi:MAG TPA: DUF4387 domain-containing protein [Bacillota bacterium]|nr:DUF4387 domain-containing protein [Bacillota bacterium]